MPSSYRRAGRAARALALCVALSSHGAAAEEAARSAIVPYTVINGSRIEESLTGRRGDAARGLRLYLQASRSGCIGCHGVPDAPGLQGTGIAEPAHAPRPGVPALDRVGMRLDPARIRLWIVAPAFLSDPGTKPSVYEVGQRHDPADPLWGGPRLTAGEVEDLVAWVSGLTGME
ncbi:MAG: hypothetical protein AAF698_00875 [Pseudomonadota bacterium]